MREIKFRAWTGSEIVQNALHVRFEPAHTHDGLDFPDSSMPAYSMCSARVFMQYTGLKDADGVEIYEGDIVRLWCAPQATAIGFISFDNGGFAFNTKKAVPNKSFIGECIDCGNSFTVIGNIYQNPELMK